MNPDRPWQSSDEHEEPSPCDCGDCGDCWASVARTQHEREVEWACAWYAPDNADDVPY